MMPDSKITFASKHRLSFRNEVTVIIRFASSSRRFQHERCYERHRSLQVLRSLASASTPPSTPTFHSTLHSTLRPSPPCSSGTETEFHFARFAAWIPPHLEARDKDGPTQGPQQLHMVVSIEIPRQLFKAKAPLAKIIQGTCESVRFP